MATVVSAVPLSIHAMLMYYRTVSRTLSRSRRSPSEIFLETRMRVRKFPTRVFLAEGAHALSVSEQSKSMLLWLIIIQSWRANATVHYTTGSGMVMPLSR